MGGSGRHSAGTARLGLRGVDVAGGSAVEVGGGVFVTVVVGVSVGSRLLPVPNSELGPPDAAIAAPSMITSAIIPPSAEPINTDRRALCCTTGGGAAGGAASVTTDAGAPVTGIIRVLV